MREFSDSLRNRFLSAVSEAATRGGSAIHRAYFSLQLAEDALHELKAFAAGYSFHDLEEEICFFKLVQPCFFKEQIYYERLLFAESNRPSDRKSGLKKYCRKMLKEIDCYCRANHALYSYYQMDRKDLDGQLFVSRPQPFPWLLPARLELDDRFANPYSLTLARLQAYRQMADYLNDLPAGAQIQQEPEGGAGLLWSGTDSQFIELLIGLHSRGAINNGNISFSELAEKFGARLGVAPQNVYQVAKNIRGRKKDRTVFLKQLIESAERRMDEADQG